MMRKKIFIFISILFSAFLVSAFFSVNKVKATCYYLGNPGYGLCAGSTGGLRCAGSGGGYYACCNQPAQGDVCPTEPTGPVGNATPVPPNPNNNATCGGTSQSCCSGNTCDNSSLTCTTTVRGAYCLDQGQISQLGGGAAPANTSGLGIANVSINCGTNGVSTAIGCIPVLGNSQGINSFFIKWGIGVASGIAFLLILYASFMIMTSAGNPERLKAGQELLTSAISGLILLIFSIFLLNFIGVKILGIFQ
jgi:hypothetical protein